MSSNFLVVNSNGVVERPTFVGNKTQMPPRLTNSGSLVTARREPDYYELAREGRIYCAQPGLVTNAVASVVDTPTTGAHWALYNAAPANSNVALLILGVSFFSASGTIGIGASLVGGVS